MEKQNIEIEDIYDVSKLSVNNELIWPILRQGYRSKIFKYKISSFSFSVSNFIYSLISMRYGFYNWFRKYDVLCFSSSGGGVRRLIKGKYRNRFIDPIIDQIGKDKALLIEDTRTTHFPMNYIPTKRITSKRVLTFLASLIYLILPPVKIDNKNILNSIKRDYNIIIDDEKIVKKYLAHKICYHLLFRLYKPKAIFLNTYYGYLPLIAIAKELNIPVIEIQHGAIGSKQAEYNHTIISNKFYPDYLLTFGKLEKSNPSEFFIFKKSQVHPLGNYIIEHENNTSRTNGFKDLSQNYDYTIGVTLTSSLEPIGNEPFFFILKAAELDKKILYLLIPRIKVKQPDNLPSNVKIINNIPFYEMMSYVDFHCTIDSTCAIEAPALGVQNILLNIENRACKFYGNILTDNKVTKFVDNPEDLVSAIRTFNKLNKSTIKTSNEFFITQNYGKNLNMFLHKMRLINS